MFEGLVKLGRENFLAVIFFTLPRSSHLFWLGDSDYNVRVRGAPLVTRTTALGLEVNGVYHLSSAFIEYFPVGCHHVRFSLQNVVLLLIWLC